MTKRLMTLIAALLMAVSGVSASGFLDRWSIRLSPGGIMPLGGQYNDVTKLIKVVDIGAGLTGGLRYRVSDYVLVGADYGLSWMRAKKDYRPFDYKEQGPALNLMMLTVNGTFFLSTGFGIKPYLTVGAGIYPWEFSQKPLWAAAWPAPADPTKTFAMNSLGFSTGLGADKHLSSKLSVYVEVMYHYIFSRNPGKFGTDDFTQQDFLGLNIGLSYDLGKK